MAKPPPIVSCKIICTKEVAIADVGPTMLKLSELGFDDISTDFVSDIPKYRQRNDFAVKAEAHLEAWTHDHPTFRIRDAIAFFREDGRSAGACYTAARVLAEKKILKQLGEGNYARTDVKALPKPKPAKKVGTKHKPKQPKQVYDPTHPVFAYRLISRNHGKCSRSWLKDQFDKAGRPGVSAPSALSELIKAKQLRRVGDGEYELVRRKAAKPKKTATKSPKPAGNGASAEVTHGNG